MLKYSVYAWWGWLSSDHISAFRIQFLLWSAAQSDQVHLLFHRYELARDFSCISSGGGKTGKAGTVTMKKRIASCSPVGLSKRSKQKGLETQAKMWAFNASKCRQSIFQLSVPLWWYQRALSLSLCVLPAALQTQEKGEQHSQHSLYLQYSPFKKPNLWLYQWTE